MPYALNSLRPLVPALALIVLTWPGCSSDSIGADAGPSLPAGSGAIPSATSGTGAGAVGIAAGAGAVAGMRAPVGAAGVAAPTAGMPTAGRASTGPAGMMAAAGASGPDIVDPSCSSTSPDADRDGIPDCMDMCAMDAMKTTPGMCGCGIAETEDCKDMPAQPTPTDPDRCKPGPLSAEVRAEYDLDAFYTRAALAEATPIVSTDAPEDEAMRRACLVVLDLSSKHPMARERMRQDHVYFIMMAKTEKTVQTPEYRSRGDLDARARGFGNNPGLCAEENVMCDRMTDRWRGESICVHEYAHVMHLYVWNRVEPMFNAKVNAAYMNAVRTMGKYRNTYAASNATEYLGEIVQNWYNTNLESSRGEGGDGVHNHINTRAELKEYDPMGYELLSTVLPDMPAYKDCYYYE
jgi:hypothetical protein